MPNSLLTAVSGLLAHQRLLDIVGNNIANINTTGYKSQRAVFSDLLYETIRPATSASEGDKGGANPMQIGGGVKMALTDRKFSQGSLELTGEQFDVAISGGGFFVVSDGIQDYFTRAGTFTPDESGILTAPGGLTVQRFPGVGEPDGTNPGFQVPGESTIRVPIGASIPGVVTTEVSYTGNLSANLNRDLATIKQSAPAFVTDSGAPADESTLLNDLKSNEADYSVGDKIRIAGTRIDGNTVSFDFDVSDTTTVGNYLDAIRAQFPDLTLELQDGIVRATANATGESTFTIVTGDVLGNSGMTNFNEIAINNEIQTGQDKDTHISTVTVYDERGGAHELELEFEKQDDDVWKVTTRMSAAEGSVLDGVIDEIAFNDDGSLLGTTDPTIVLQVNGIAEPQAITFSFTDPNSPETLTHFPTDTAIAATQNGAGPGTLVSVNVESDGRISGIASNGRTVTIAQLLIASVRNPKGLVAEGNSLYSVSLNSGEPEFGLAGSGSRGTVQGGQLESSNVDVAFEFTRLIVAQRGFSANARTITVADEVLEELTNIIR